MFSLTGILVAALVIAIAKILQWILKPRPPNPFSKDSRTQRKPYIQDQKVRDKILKQAFSVDKVPEKLDAVIIGSGIGGLTTGVIMAKSGKKVLILEQHDQAGGCCHTFTEKGFEFDVGIHYVGEMGSQTLNKTLCDQITDGQLEWSALEPEFDVVSIGYGDENRMYPVTTGIEAWKSLLKKQFPQDIQGIEKYFDLMETCENTFILHGILKIVPLWLVRLAIKSGILKFVTNLWTRAYTSRTLDVVQSLTDNKELQTVMMYGWGDYGTLPSKSYFTMQALLNQHFMVDGGHYPVGGASEIAYNMIPIIEKAGGKVLVRANVEEIIIRNGKACGVRVVKGKEKYNIDCDMVISSAGLYNTFNSLIPKSISHTSYFSKICSELKPGVATMICFLGLDASKEELGVRPQNYWAFTSNDINATAEEYLTMKTKDALDTDVPLLFISFPSTKDPQWDKHPQRQGKTTMQIITLSNYDWFKQWKDNPVKNRGDSYDEIKNCIGHKMIEQACQLFPQIRDKIIYTEIASPLTNQHYIAQPNGEIYGLDHTLERFDPMMVAKLRPETDIPGLYMTGQDTLEAGFTGALFSGVITAQVCLGRPVLWDLIKLHDKLEAQNNKKIN